MAKKRKTKKEKIKIKKKVLNPSFKPSQEAILKETSPKINEKKILKKNDKQDFSDDFAPIKKDLLKSLLITLGIISLELVLYLKLK
jgi:hypothetical protein